jgi:glycosyltransferase involved in cell wall biosynthesis
MNVNALPLSIGYLSPGWPLNAFPNGVVSYVADMADQLKKMGHQITVVAADVVGKTGDIAIYDVQLARQRRRLIQRVLDGVAYRIGPRWAVDRIWHRLFATVIRRAIAEQGIKIFEMEESFGRAWSVRRTISIPLCVRLHGPWFLNGGADGVLDDQVFRQRVFAEGRAIASADAVSSSSRDVLERTRAYYNLALHDAEVIYPPSCSVLPAEQWRLEDCNSKQVLFVGRFDRHKGGDLAIEAFGQVLREVPQARLVFVGPDQGYTDSHGRSWSLDGFVRDRLPGTLESGRIALLGQQPFSALAALRRKAMITIVCSRYENAPRALIEAMSLGCPVVAARVGGIPEILEDERDGFLHRPEDSNDLSARIIALLNNPGHAAELGRNAAETCRRRFHPEIIARQTIEFYRRLVRRRDRDTWRASKRRGTP